MKKKAKSPEEEHGRKGRNAQRNSKTSPHRLASLHFIVPDQDRKSKFVECRPGPANWIGCYSKSRFWKPKMGSCQRDGQMKSGRVQGSQPASQPLGEVRCSRQDGPQELSATHSPLGH
jgi:hypothetical protein